uniref:Putative histone-lysine n-methyltransferase setmar-like protein n=1 Tax=Ixodes ricinus TaxID=34613 RepID=A0A6B0V0X1_IXORI
MINQLAHQMIIISARHFFFRKTTKQLEQRYCIKFLWKLCNTQVETEIFTRISAAMPWALQNIKEVYYRIKDGRMTVGSNARPGRPSTSRNNEVIDQVRSWVMQDHRNTIQEHVTEVGGITDSVNSILKEHLALQRVSEKFVLKLLTMELHQNNAPARFSHLIQSFLARIRLRTLPTWLLVISGSSP